MKQTPENIGCVIMASGMGKRFGSNKLLAAFRGKPMIEYILDITGNDLFTKRVVVTRSTEIYEICNKNGIECILHSLPNRNDTIRLGLEHMEGMEACVFCPSDQPLLSRDTLLREVVSFSGNPDEILRLKSGESYGIPVLFGKSYFEELCKLSEGMGGSCLMRKYADKVICIETENEYELFDVDTREELEFLEGKF